MARTWSLVATLTNSLKKAPYFCTGGDKLYFIESGSSQAVISWDGTTETDISGSSWSGDDEVMDVCYFNSTLYAAVNTYDGVGGYGCGIYSYDGTGQSWTLEQTLQIGEDDCLFNDQKNDAKMLVSDGNRIATVVSSGSVYRQLFMSTDGSTWTQQTINGGSSYGANEYLLGTQFTELTEITCIAQFSSVRRAIQYDSGDDWSFIAADIGGNGPVLVGYADGKSFFADNGISNVLTYSTDWGVNITPTSLSAIGGTDVNAGQPRVWYLADNAIMSLDESGDPTAFVWDSDTNDFVEDGDTGTDDISGFFSLGSTLYAICATKIYSGGSLNGGEPATNEFHYGIESLAKMCDLSFGVKPKGMAINPDTSDVVVVSDTAQTTMSERMLKSENYATANDYSDGLATDEDIDAVEYI